MMVSGLSSDAVLAALTSKLGLTPAAAKATVEDAEKRIVLAANYDRTRELGTAIARLNDLYRRAVAIQDTKTALQTQRELNRLLNLYEPPADATLTQADADTIEAHSRRYLDSLALGDASTPLPELCRRAAARILALESRKTTE
jgi:hypothetical protein